MGIDPSNPQQARERAQQLGIPEGDIQRVFQEAQINKTTVQTLSDTTKTLSDTTKVIGELPLSETGQETVQIDVSSFSGKGRFVGLGYYGYDIFQKAKESVGPIEIGPVDPGYPIGAGDVLRLTLWGEIEYQYEFEVSREGNIVIPKVGQVFVAGTRLERLRESLKNYLSKFYSGLANDPPSIFMDVTIARLRSNQIYIMGEVDRPGAYSVSSYATAFNALYAVGGAKVTGSLRETRILREGKVVARVDLYDYMLKGISTDDIRLQHNDIVFVPPRGQTIGIKGEILRPAIYEITGQETLKDLIEMAGSLTPTAYAFRAQIDRIVPFEKRQKGEFERELTDINIDEVMQGGKTVPLYDGDIVTIFPIIDEMINYVDIAGGGIKRPGRYELNNKVVTLSDLITEADSLYQDAYLSRADIIRTRDDFTEEFIQVNLGDALRNELSADIRLKRWDRIYIYSQREMVGLPTVTLSGFVKQPGTYALPDNLTLSDLLFKYSGLQDSLRLARTFMERGDILRLGEDAKIRFIIPFNLLSVWKNEHNENVVLKRGDNVVLYEKTVKEVFTRKVDLIGAVKNPGTYEWKENITLSDIILEGGGFSEDASIFEAEVARFPQNGISGDSLAMIFNVPILETERLPDNLEMITASILNRKTKASSFYLMPNDIIFIRTNPDFKYSKTVDIIGEVKYPGNYALESRNEKLSNIIERAGGLKPSAFPGGGQLYRGDKRVFIDFEKVLEKKDNKEDIILLHGDRIIVPPQPNAVQIQGEVINPGIYKYIQGSKAKDYLNFSGGKTENGDKVYVQGPSGRLQKMTLLKNPKVQDGSIITVYLKPPTVEKKETDWSQTIQNSFAIMSSALMIVYLSQQVK